MDLAVQVNNTQELLAERGHVYEYYDGHLHDEPRYVLIVSSDNRKCDRMVSMIMLGTSKIGRDVVEIRLPLFRHSMYVHCGMVSYTKRENLMEDMGEIAEDTMAMVDKYVAKELGIYENMRSELAFYKHEYSNLIQKLVNSTKIKLIGDIQNGSEKFSSSVSSENI